MLKILLQKLKFLQLHSMPEYEKEISMACYAIVGILSIIFVKVFLTCS